MTVLLARVLSAFLMQHSPLPVAPYAEGKESQAAASTWHRKKGLCPVEVWAMVTHTCDKLDSAEWEA